MRIAVGWFSQETDTFSPLATDLATFERQGYAFGEAFALRGPGAEGAAMGFAEVAHARGGVELVPLLKARSGAGGRVTREAFETILGRFLARLDAVGPVDAVYVALHGAMAAEHHDDPEGLLLEALRARIGARAWLVASMDHHACVTRRKIAAADVSVGHRTHPHDPPDTGRATARAFFSAWDRGRKPARALRKVAMVTHQEQFLTARPPMKTWFDLARAIEARPGVLSVSTYPMQPWLDVEEGGWAAVVHTDDDPALAARLADELAACAWDLRHDFWRRDSIPVATAVARAAAAAGGIVVLSDTGDSTIGGATGDSVAILAEVLRQGMPAAALVPLVDPPAARAALAAGPGAVLDLSLGHALDPAQGRPVAVRARVEAALPGRAGAFDPAMQGAAALLRVGPALVAVTELRGRRMHMPEFWADFGVDATDRSAVRAVVVKTGSNFQFFAPWTAEVIRVDSPGHTRSGLDEFDWRRLPRPIFPLDADAGAAPGRGAWPP
ncbi:MAG: M81 family metallopeptidase [Rhodobacteraceae bacterium]|nr:M81 family metallopeptidase [Paracoccaceae bacterium]